MSVLQSGAAEERVPRTLDEESCWRLLQSQEVGRLAMDTPGGLVVLPVNYAVLNGRVVFRTSEGGLLGTAAGYGRRVAFEVDSVDRMARSGWSVLLRGELRQADERTSASADPVVDTWLHRDDALVVAMQVDQVSGRSLPF